MILAPLVKTKPLPIISALGLLVLATLTLMARIPNVPAVPHLYTALYLITFALYAVAAILFRSGSERRLVLLILGFAILFRLVFLPVRPTVSTDIYRYIWDGRVSTHETNPYRYVPSSQSLRHLRTENWRKINYPGTNTPYLPTSQIVFAFAYRLFGENLLGLKLVFLLADMAVIALILRSLSVLRLPACAVIVYAWSPLVITEFAGAGHQDVVGLALLMGAIYLAISSRRIAAGALLAGSVLVKPYAIAALPMFARYRGLRLLIAALGAGWLLYLPYWNIEPRFLFAGATAYAEHWRGNDSLFYLLEWVTGLFTSNPEHAAKLVTLGLLAILMAWLTLRKPKGPMPLVKSVFITLAAVLLLSPTVYPWYVAWSVPFLCFIFSPGWFIFTGTVILCYLMSLYGNPLWLRTAEYLPVFLAFGFSILRPRLQFGARQEQPENPRVPR